MFKRQILVAMYIMLVFLSGIEANNKKVNCRKYVFAPVCRGVAAKRDMKLEPSDYTRTPRCFSEKVLQKYESDLNTPVKTKQWKNNQVVLENIINKLLKSSDYQSFAANDLIR